LFQKGHILHASTSQNRPWDEAAQFDSKKEAITAQLDFWTIIFSIDYLEYLIFKAHRCSFLHLTKTAQLNIIFYLFLRNRKPLYMSVVSLVV